jgi:antibiotic biosynthesis monooxygenase (ABM) superfamily enzyme
MAVLTWLGVCPTVAVWVVLFRDSLGLSFLGDLLVSNLFVVGTLTWVTMPTITRLFRSWLRA